MSFEHKLESRPTWSEIAVSQWCKLSPNCHFVTSFRLSYGTTEKLLMDCPAHPDNLCNIGWFSKNMNDSEIYICLVKHLAYNALAYNLAYVVYNALLVILTSLPQAVEAGTGSLPGKRTGILPHCVGMWSGRPRRCWSWTWQGLQRIIRGASRGVSATNDVI